MTIVLMLAAGGVLLPLIDRPSFQMLPRDIRAPLVLWALIGEFFLLVLGAIVVHEIGHVLAGWCVGFRLLSVRVGAVELNARFLWTLVDEPESKAAGLTQMLPVGSKAYRTRSLIMTLGGAAANLLSSFVVAKYVSFGSPAHWFAGWSFLLGVVSLIPSSQGKFVSDGKRILMLFRRSIENNRNIAIVKIVADLSAGRTSEQIDATIISAATAVTDRSFSTFLAFRTAYLHSWERLPEPEVARLLEVALEMSGFASPPIRDALFADAGTFQAKKRKSVVLALQWLNALPKTPATPWARLWLETAILEAKEDFPQALEKLVEIEGMLNERKVRKTSLEEVQRWRSELLQKAEKQQVAGRL